jgi:DNA topoisomerase-2
VPIIPMVLVNGTEGIGTGFSSFVPSYNPDDIKRNLLLCLSQKEPEPLVPWFRGFTGTVKAGGPQEWIAEGTYVLNGDTITITELPPGRWLQDYKEHLDELVEKKIISSFKNGSTDEKVYFEIHNYNGQDLIKDFKLQKTFRTSNMHLFHPTGIKKYNDPNEILVDFLEIRHKYYQKRKDHLIKILDEKTRILDTKARFIQLVISGNIVIFKKKKTEIELMMMTHKFKSDTFEYLFNIKTCDYTEESIDELNKKSRELRGELDTLKKKSIIDLWKADLGAE